MKKEVKYMRVKASVFYRVSERIKQANIDSFITVWYNGTSLYGDIIISEHAGHSKEYKQALQIFVEEYCK